MKNTFKTFNKNSLAYCLFLAFFCNNITAVFAQGTPILMSIDLLKFEGEKKGAYIHMFWSKMVPSQDNYLVERAGEDGIFSVIGTESNDSDFWDKQPLNETNYYRLVLDNNDGSNSYSNIIAVEYHLPIEIQLMPNPATDYIKLSFFVEPNSEANVVVINQQGSIVSEQKIDAPFGGVQQLEIDLHDYAAGMYLMRISDGDITRIRKFVVLD